MRLEPESDALGAIIVAKPRTELRDQWVPLVWRLAVAVLVGVVLAGLLSWWLSRKITGPVTALASAADEIAGGTTPCASPSGHGGDEITHLSERFNEMAARLAATEERERQFLMSVSHELRTPLTAIKGHVDAIRDGLFDDPELERASLDVVAGETIRLERLVGDVLDLAKLNAHRFTVYPQEVDMAVLVERAHASFGEEARRRDIDFRLDEDPEAPTIVTDGDRVLQVITNLLANAFRWTPDGGTVQLASELVDGSVRVDVSDTGPGIRPEEQERIFVPFISRDNHGTGLGLPIARELAHALGGRLELESTVGEGSRFTLVLPAALTAARTRVARGSPDVPAEPGERLTPLTAPPSRRAVRDAARRFVRAFVALRPRQWLKNLLLFAGILFAAELGGQSTLARGVRGVRRVLRRVERRVPRQRCARRRSRPAHPVKRRRPIARGELGPGRHSVSPGP